MSTLALYRIPDPAALVSKFIGKGVSVAAPKPPPPSPPRQVLPPELRRRAPNHGLCAKDHARYVRWWRLMKTLPKEQRTPYDKWVEPPRRRRTPNHGLSKDRAAYKRWARRFGHLVGKRREESIIRFIQEEGLCLPT